jgi:endogenous inhibitor of DNA gyrase (YacG/DUF329 family)
MNQPPKCPICNKQLVGEDVRRSEFFPFCSERCRHVDFFRWSEGKYAIVEPLAALPDTLVPLADDEIE